MVESAELSPSADKNHLRNYKVYGKYNLKGNIKAWLNII